VRARHTGEGEVGDVGEVDVGDVGDVGEDGAGEVGAGEVGAAEVGGAEVDADEVGAGEVGSEKSGAFEVKADGGAGEVGASLEGPSASTLTLRAAEGEHRRAGRLQAFPKVLSKPMQVAPDGITHALEPMAGSSAAFYAPTHRWPPQPQTDRNGGRIKLLGVGRARPLDCQWSSDGHFNERGVRYSATSVQHMLAQRG
jgi:hypothetical protein